MRYPGSIIIAVLEIMSYDTWLTITHFPCSVSIRQDLADSLVNAGLIELGTIGYRLTFLGETFLNNYIK